ncbi:dsDNA nuclease domain-containing protein [Psychrobacter sanguinis]|uniref:dsDNA nuclease domain-containing protein n=1 Tax=Psychrobacter sanguinis TaxID=861445 RepID=UPI00191B7DBA|nr:dsDNA nuclease domain-containing protein [Psychrobacter sanguinis]MCC3344555.1 DUF4297 domain-containing protein [Psychrobacter sanguinis]
MDVTNPLYAEQREKSGSTTLGKYFYQYNWALNEALNKLDDEQKYIVFMEAHEDVVFADSFDESAKFSFIQVKEKNKALSLKDMVRKSKDEVNSILGKALLSVKGKSYQENVKSICIVVSTGFNFKKTDLKTSTNLQIHRISDFNQGFLDELSKTLKAELGDEVDLSALEFHSSKLSVDFEGARHQLIGKVAEIMKRFFPNSYYQAEDAYIAIIDDLHKKGICSYDYQEWKDFIKNKGLKSDEILKVLHRSTNNDFDKMRENFEDLADELEIKKGLTRNKIRNELQRIHQDVFNLNSMYISNVEEVDEIISNLNIAIDDVDNDLISEIVDKVTEKNVIEDDAILTPYDLVLYCVTKGLKDGKIT